MLLFLKRRWLDRKSEQCEEGMLLLLHFQQQQRQLQNSKVGPSVRQIFQICSYEKTVGGKMVPPREKDRKKKDEHFGSSSKM
jgi:hypothetical protein